jgi:hypothetical protein
MTTPVLSVSDGTRTTVNDLVGNPLMIPARILEVLRDQFIAEALLRNAGANGNGLVSYSESTPLYLGDDVEEVAEFAEIPVGAGQRGLPRIAYATKRGLGVRVSREMRDENRIDDVNRQITQLRNTMIRAEARVLRTLLTNPAIPTIAATAAWTGGTAKIRHDIARAAEVVASAKPPSAPTEDDDVLGFEPNTIVFPGNITPVLMDNDEFLKVYQGGGPSDEDISYTGKLPGQVLGLDALKARSWDPTRVLVVERGVAGFYSDTRPLEATPLYGEGGGPNGGPTETWRSDSTRKRAMGLDQPLAACWITGVQA